MRRLATFLRKPRTDQRLLVCAALLHVIVTISVRLLPFGVLRRALACLAALGRRPPGSEDLDARAMQAVRTTASLVPGATCLTEALVAQCLLARQQSATTLCFGVSRSVSDRRFAAHAWLERSGSHLFGARATVYDPLHHPTRCTSSPLPR